METECFYQNKEYLSDNFDLKVFERNLKLLDESEYGIFRILKEESSTNVNYIHLCVCVLIYFFRSSMKIRIFVTPVRIGKCFSESRNWNVLIGDFKFIKAIKPPSSMKNDCQFTFCGEGRKRLDDVDGLHMLFTLQQLAIWLSHILINDDFWECRESYLYHISYDMENKQHILCPLVCVGNRRSVTKIHNV